MLRQIHEVSSSHENFRNTVETVTRAFIQIWVTIFCTFIMRTTYKEAQGECELFNNLSKLLRSNRVRCTTYHLEANGKVGCFHNQLKAAPILHLDYTQWAEFLPIFVLKMRTAVKTNSPSSVAERFFVMNPRLTREFINFRPKIEELDLAPYVD